MLLHPSCHFQINHFAVSRLLETGCDGNEEKDPYLQCTPIPVPGIGYFRYWYFEFTAPPWGEYIGIVESSVDEAQSPLWIYLPTQMLSRLDDITFLINLSA